MIEWICVEDALPNDRQWVLACDSKDVRIVQFFKIDGCFEHHSIIEYKRDKITHWMPLPELPKRNENE